MGIRDEPCFDSKLLCSAACGGGSFYLLGAPHAVVAAQIIGSGSGRLRRGR